MDVDEIHENIDGILTFVKNRVEDRISSPNLSLTVLPDGNGLFFAVFQGQNRNF